MNPNSVSFANDAPCQAGGILDFVYQVVSNCDCLLFAAEPQVCRGFLLPFVWKPLPVAKTIDSMSVVRVNAVVQTALCHVELQIQMMATMCDPVHTVPLLFDKLLL